MRNSIRRALLLSAALAPCTVWAAGPHVSEAFSYSRGQVFEEEGGAALFGNVCAGCHQSNAEGAVGAGEYPALADNKVVGSADSLIRLLLEGQRGMPALGQMMSDRQIADVINYVRTHFSNAYGDEVSPADVEAARRPGAPLP